MWLDALELRVDRKPLERAKPRPPSGYWDDHRFDGGSGVEVESLTPTQIENLVMLGEVWGFLKYHHLVVTSGQRQWDYSLFEVLPAFLDAPDAATARRVIRGQALVGAARPYRGEHPSTRRANGLCEAVIGEAR